MQKYILRLFQQLQITESNSLISPFCFDLLLGIIAEGATGELQKALKQLLEVKDEPNPFNSLANKLAALTTLSHGSEVKQSNTFLYSDELIPVEAFYKKVQSRFQLQLEKQTFEEKDLVFIIESTLAVKALWKQAFEQVRHKTEFFTLANGEEVETLFIKQSNTKGHNDTLYLKEAHFHAIQLPLKDERLCVEIYLPYQKDGLNDLIASLDADFFDGTAFEPVKFMEVVLPKFDVGLSYNLKDFAQQLGIEDLFQPGWDLSSIFKSDDVLFIKKITQKNTFKLNEDGIEAGSISRAYGGIGSSAQVNQYVLFEAIHPFMYLVRDKETNTLLFMGVFEEPDQTLDFSQLYKNEEIFSKFDKGIETLSYRVKFVITAYSLETLIQHFKVNNAFINWYVDQLWKLIEAPDEIQLKKSLVVLENINWYDQSLKGDNQSLREELQESLKTVEQEVPSQVTSIIYSLHGQLSYIEDALEHASFTFGFFILDTLNLPPPDWDLLSKYQRSPDNPWGAPIIRMSPTSLFKPTLSKITLTAIQQRARQQSQTLRRFKPKILTITIRGLAYLGLVCLNKIKPTSYQIPDDLQIWIQDIITFISNKDTAIDLAALDFWSTIDTTGYSTESHYLAEAEQVQLKIKHPSFAKAIANLSHLLSSLNYLGDDWFLNTSRFIYPTSLLEILVDNDIDLPALDLFEKLIVVDEHLVGEEIVINMDLIDGLLN